MEVALVNAAPVDGVLGVLEGLVVGKTSRKLEETGVLRKPPVRPGEFPATVNVGLTLTVTTVASGAVSVTPVGAWATTVTVVKSVSLLGGGFSGRDGGPPTTGSESRVLVGVLVSSLVGGDGSVGSGFILMESVDIIVTVAVGNGLVIPIDCEREALDGSGLGKGVGFPEVTVSLEVKEIVEGWPSSAVKRL